jgi:acyl carrier protein|tara:strand:+ start:698 stop:925 length:228 start_codon:yes stop_codon:yes gene_type:complete
MKERVREVAGKVFGVDTKSLDLESSPDSVEQWDSLNHMKLLLALEEEFNIQFTDQEIADMMSIGNIIEIVSAKGC